MFRELTPTEMDHVAGGFGEETTTDRVFKPVDRVGTWEGRLALFLSGGELVYEGTKLFLEYLARDESLVQRMNDFQRLTGECYFPTGNKL